ncbi:MAG: Pilus assembly protein, PilO [Firmicutes bacterium]|nr:Pilus assembly protein, PilO [Bacillota bacterium]
MDWRVKLQIKCKALTQYKLWLLGGSALLFTLLFYIWIVVPQRTTMTTLAARHQIEQQRLKVIETYAKQHPDSSAHLKELDIKLTQLDAKLPNQLEIGEFIKEIEQVSKLKDMKLVEIKPLAAVNKASYREISIEIFLRGSFANLLEFVKSIESNQRFTTISHTNIQAKQGMLDVKLTMNIYSFGVAEENAETKQPKNSALPAKK